MPTTNLYIKSKQKESSVYIRFTNGRKLDRWTPTNVFVDAKKWDAKRQKIKGSTPTINKINSKLTKLKTELLDEFNLASISGVIIDKYWVDETVAKCLSQQYNRKDIEEERIYFSDYAQHWLDNKSDDWQTGPHSKMSKRLKIQYQSLLNLFKVFEGKKKIKLTEIDKELLLRFSEYLNDKDYQYQTVKRYMNRIRFFCNRAIEDQIKVNPRYNSNIYLNKSKTVKSPYLNEDEIQAIYNYDFSYSKHLDNVRDNFIIGLWTGLRVSDFLTQLNINLIKDDFIDIKTKKTNTFVSLPLHPMIVEILDKRNGELPEKVTTNTFNKRVKEICMIVGIDNLMEGKLVVLDKKTKRKRKVYGTYKKYQLVSSHICRRSFATNLFGKIPNQVLMKLGGWTTESVMLNYISKSSREHAEYLGNFWKKKYQLK